MANTLYNQFNNLPINTGGISDIINQVQMLQKTLKGDPKAMVQDMLNNGQMTQDQFNELAQMANQIMPFMPK